MKHFALVPIALVLAGCATAPATSTAGSSGTQAAPEEKEYRTGSRIPVRDPSAAPASSVKTLDPSALGTGLPPRAQ